MAARIETDLTACAVSEIDGEWRVVAHRPNWKWVYFGRLSLKTEQQEFRDRAFGRNPTISVITGRDPAGKGFLLYARLMPVKFMADPRLRLV